MIRMVVLQRVMVLLVVVLVTPLSAQTRPVRVYVFTTENEGGFIDEASKGRTDSVRDLQKSLIYSKDWRKQVALVSSAADAELTLEVKGRGSKDTGTTSIYRDPLWGGIKSSPDSAATLWVKMSLTGREYTLGIVGACPSSVIFRVWTCAAGFTADKVVRWVKDNDARIPRK